METQSCKEIKCMLGVGVALGRIEYMHRDTGGEEFERII